MADTDNEARAELVEEYSEEAVRGFEEMMGDYYIVNDTRQIGSGTYEVASGHVFRSV